MLRPPFPSRSVAERRAIVRSAFEHFGRLLFEILKFSTLPPEAMLARVEFEGEERVASCVRAREGRAVRDRPFRVLGAAGDGSRAQAQADGGAGARARQPPAERSARADPHADREYGDLPARAPFGA